DRKAAAAGQADGNRRVEMTSGNMADRIRHRQHSQTESQGDAEQADANLRKAGRDHRAAAAAEGQPKSAYHLGSKRFPVHGKPPLRVPPRRYVESRCYYKAGDDLSAHHLYTLCHAIVASMHVGSRIRTPGPAPRAARTTSPATLRQTGPGGRSAWPWS